MINYFNLDYALSNTHATTIADPICEHHDEINLWERLPNDKYLQNKSTAHFLQIIEKTLPTLQ